MEGLVYEMHAHTPLCKHALGEPEEYAQVAWERGMKGIVITCHSPLPEGISSAVRMDEGQLPDYQEMVLRAQAAWQGRVDVRMGMESDYFPGTESYIERLHGRMNFHHVLGSVHPHIKEYRLRYDQGDWSAFHRQYFLSLAEAAETGLFDTLAHPDIVKNLGSAEWNLDRLWPDILRCLDRIAQTGVAMELNTSGLNKVFPEMNPGIRMLAAMFERSIPVVVGADAHVPQRVGDGFLQAYQILEEVGYREVSYFLERKQKRLSIKEAANSLFKEKNETVKK
jgi:histidinol-phosphatase (PHP family)